MVVVALPLPVTYAALMLWNYRSNLIDALEQVRASRQRIVDAAYEARRQIERDLHDGAQQSLMGMMMRAHSGHYPTDELVADLRSAVAELRDLAHGIYPPILAQRGLAAALSATAQRAPMPVSVDCDGVGRYPDPMESTVYFCTLEALQNVSKHAGESVKVTVQVWSDPDSLHFRVSDNGVGFDPGMVSGMGLTNMADRVGAAGGRLRVDSVRGRGTTIEGVLPIQVS